MDAGELIRPTVGGLLIGLSASMLLLLKGRVFGVSGILAGVLIPKKLDTAWRAAALVGLATAGVVFMVLQPEALAAPRQQTPWRFVAAGLLVGFGTQLGSGCTSGHGVCGVSRLSPRSLVATLSFMAAGVATVAMVRALGGTP